LESYATGVIGLRYVSRETYEEGWQHETSSLYGDVFLFGEAMRKKEREVKDRQEIITIIERCKILCLGLKDNDYPYVVPLNFGFENIDDRYLFYFHAAKEGRKLDLIKNNNKCSITLYNDLGADKVKTTNYYECIMGEGQVTEVVDNQEKLRILTLMLKKYDFIDVEPIDVTALAKTYVGKITVTNLSAKANKEATK
jgi:nitroimidazol reductase NimA-like FMN-containing flavoprotein (pyridoxamine 5'-phosphate oxidase superfamily)